MRELKRRSYAVEGKKPVSNYYSISKYPVLANLVDGTLTDMEMGMLDTIIGRIMDVADELEQHKNDTAYNGANADKGGYPLHSIGRLLKDADVFAKFANRLRRNSLYNYL